LCPESAADEFNKENRPGDDATGTLTLPTQRIPSIISIDGPSIILITLRVEHRTGLGGMMPRTTVLGIGSKAINVFAILASPQSLNEQVRPSHLL
jgi:hypothetical protein